MVCGFESLREHQLMAYSSVVEPTAHNGFVGSSILSAPTNYESIPWEET